MPLLIGRDEDRLSTSSGGGKGGDRRTHSGGSWQGSHIGSTASQVSSRPVSRRGSVQFAEGPDGKILEQTAIYDPATAATIAGAGDTSLDAATPQRSKSVRISKEDPQVAEMTVSPAMVRASMERLDVEAASFKKGSPNEEEEEEDVHGPSSVASRLSQRISGRSPRLSVRPKYAEEDRPYDGPMSFALPPGVTRDARTGGSSAGNSSAGSRGSRTSGKGGAKPNASPRCASPLGDLGVSAKTMPSGDKQPTPRGAAGAGRKATVPTAVPTPGTPPLVSEEKKKERPRTSRPLTVRVRRTASSSIRTRRSRPRSMQAIQAARLRSCLNDRIRLSSYAAGRERRPESAANWTREVYSSLCGDRERAL